MGLPSFIQCTIFLPKKPKKSLMETVVSKSKKDITFSTIGLGCQSFKSLTYDIPSRRSLSFFLDYF
jgi:hypothetical protein